jgi:hypothetical protein
VRRARAAAALALAVTAIGAPSASAAADTTPPSAPTDVTAFLDNCFGSFIVQWQASSDNVDAAADLRYRFYDRDGRLMTGFEGATEYDGDPTAMLSPQRPHTARAVDRAGNVSTPAVVGEWQG